jgi:hypothetical protein
VRDENINDIVDAFVRIRSHETLDEIDDKSINDILILFNQWITIGKGQQEKFMPGEVIEIPRKEQNLEEQVGALQQVIPNTEQLYQSQGFLPGEIYSSEAQIYSTPMGQFISQEHQQHEDQPYKTKSALYKIH